MHCRRNASRSVFSKLVDTHGDHGDIATADTQPYVHGRKIQVGTCADKTFVDSVLAFCMTGTAD
jgi:hypothetical protein